MAVVRSFLIALALAAAALTASTGASASSVSCWTGYSYVGVQSGTAAFGASAVLSAPSLPTPSSGHVAAWIGFGGAGMGPGGSDEWVQAGIAADAGGVAHLYYEFKRPGDREATYVQLEDVARAQTHSISVVERAAERDSWSVQIDGVRVSAPIVLPGSHGLFSPVATAENWDGGAARQCNNYSFAFSRLALQSKYGGRWQSFDLSRVLHDPAYQLTLRASGFSASSR